MGNVMVDDSKEQLSKDDVSFIAKTRKWNIHVAHKAFEELIEMMEAKKEGDATFTGPVVVKYYERMMNEMGYSGWDLPTDLSLRLKRFVGQMDVDGIELADGYILVLLLGCSI